MDVISSRRTATQLVFATVFVTAFLVIPTGCTRPALRNDVGTSLAPPEGLPSPPGRDPATREYFKKKIGFNNILNGRTTGSFRSGTKEVRLKIEPENRAHEVDWFLAAKDSYRGGSIVARIQNLDDVDVPELGLQGKDDAVYIWVGPLKADYSETGIAFYKFDADGNVVGEPHMKIYTVLRCKDSWNLRPSVKTSVDHNPADCHRTVLGAAPAALRAAVHLTSHTPKLESVLTVGGLWISCSGGCCDIGEGAFY